MLVLLKDELSKFIAYQKSLNRSLIAVKQQGFKIERFLNFLAEKYQIYSKQELRKEVIEQYGIHLSQSTTKENLPYKAQYQNQLRLAVRSFLKYLKRPELLDSLKLVKEAKLLPSSVLSHKEALKFLESVKTDNPLGFRDRTILELFYSSGIRVSELSGLDIHDLNLSEKTARVTGKGQKERIVVFGETAKKYLENYLKAIRPFLRGASHSEALFLGVKGARLGIKGIETRVQKYAENLGFENVTPHTFRRSCTTNLVKNNANLYHVKELLGHENLNTLKAYTKLNVNDLKKTLKDFHPRK